MGGQLIVGCRMRPWPQNTKRRWPLRAVEGRVASVRSLSLPLATLWLDAVTLAAVWPAFLPGVDVWPPAQHDLAALWSPCLHVAPTEVSSSRRRVAVDASRRWLRSGHCRFATFGRLSGPHGVPGGWVSAQFELIRSTDRWVPRFTSYACLQAISHVLVADSPATQIWLPEAKLHME